MSLLCEIAGSAALGYATKVKQPRAAILFGQTAENGKSQILDLVRRLLPQNAVFRQTAWDNAKLRAVTTLAASPYASAKIVASEARIDPEARTAELSVEIASGPPFRVGRIEVVGLKRYDANLVLNYSTLRPGDP